MARIALLAPEIANVAQAVEETITTPAPGFGHGHIGDIAAALTFLVSLFS